ncbi:cation diffusion facilitator family transporter [Colletotrichum sojae]|uniref:Cation diffusion facilitator family transporter n=1 Tax=Colletotrichum sojae TaxID=2175907 RepID=A0A8H6MX41_9PEZI|nr:cation diffusion facilitator family transporter [Colletotrichum sojae]
MVRLKVTKKQRLVATIAISGAFFIAELVVGFRTKSLALIADAFHYMNDLVGFSVALLAVVVSSDKSILCEGSNIDLIHRKSKKLSDRKTAPETLTFGWKRAQVLGAFFNGVFLLALGLSILLQAVERFTNLHHVEDPVLILVMGCIGLGLNVIVMSFLHGQCDSPKQPFPDPGDGDATRPPQKAGRDLGMLGVMIHVLGDAINNAGVIVAAAVIWKGTGEARFYADPGVGLLIALTIMVSAWPLCRQAGHILLESAPPGVDIEELRAEAVRVSGVQDITDLRVWRLDQETTLAAARVVVVGGDNTLHGFSTAADAIGSVLRLRGIRAVALQPVQAPSGRESDWSNEAALTES